MGDYPDDWDEIARAIKDLVGWNCEHCGHGHEVATGYVLTVHHLYDDKSDCSYKNLVALCQRCHLSIQSWYVPGQQMLPGIEVPEWMVKRGLIEKGEGSEDNS